MPQNIVRKVKPGANIFNHAVGTLGPDFAAKLGESLVQGGPDGPLAALMRFAGDWHPRQ